MNRRQFFQTTGAAGAAALFAAADATAQDEADMKKQSPPFMDMDVLRNRNRDRSTVVCRHGMVCASQPLATLAGIDMLKAGGTCVDAAIAANAMLGLTEPASNGIGGDLFAIVWSEKDQRLYGLNASGRAPKDWTLRRARRLNLDEIPRRSPLAWSVPGCVSGWGMLSERFGKLGLGKSLQPAIQYAHEGFPLSPIISTHFQGWKDDEAPHMAHIYHPDGKVPQYGDVFQNEMLGRSLEAIAADGPDAFYQGWIAEAIVAKSKELDGYMQLEDLRNHTANWVDPVSASYRGWDVWEIPPNGQGIAALQILNMLESFDLASFGHNSPQHLHLFIEAKKLAFEDRAHYYADPDFADVPIEWLISKEYAQQRAKRIDPKAASESIGHGDPRLDSDTVYLCAADDEGNMISLIQSLYSGFGSTIAPDGVGFTIQNRGQGFSLNSKHRNRLEGGKRPFHTIIPAFLTRDGRPVMPFGVMGGDFQPQGHAQVIMNMIDFGMSPQQATDVPRLEHTGSSDPWGETVGAGGRLVFERGFDEATKLALAQMGHDISPSITAHGGYQAIWREENPRRYFGGSDPRKDGCAIGF